MRHRWMRTGWFKGITAIIWTTVLSGPLQAQVGLASGVARVALVAHVAPRGSIEGVSDQRENGRVGGIREVSATVQLSANTGYQLLVRRIGAPGSRIWVRTAGGEFQELTAGGTVTVVREHHRAGRAEREVHYRIEVPESGEPAGPLPVRYEIAINPTM